MEQFQLGNHAATNNVIPNPAPVKVVFSSSILLTQNFKEITKLKDQLNENFSIMEQLTLTKRDIWTEEYLKIEPMTDVFFNQMLDMFKNYFYIIGIVSKLLAVANWKKN